MSFRGNVSLRLERPRLRGQSRFGARTSSASAARRPCKGATGISLLSHGSVISFAVRNERDAGARAQVLESQETKGGSVRETFGPPIVVTSLKNALGNGRRT